MPRFKPVREVPEYERLAAGYDALRVLLFLDEEGDGNGRCVDKRCRSRGMCMSTCPIRAALIRAGLR